MIGKMVQFTVCGVVAGVIASVTLARLNPRPSSTPATQLRGHMVLLQNCIESYRTHHDGRYPDPGRLVAQLTSVTRIDGTVVDSTDPEGCCGPYLQEMPALPTGRRAGNRAVQHIDEPPTRPHAAPVGWLYQAESGRIWPNDADHLHAPNARATERAVGRATPAADPNRAIPTR